MVFLSMKFCKKQEEFPGKATHLKLIFSKLIALGAESTVKKLHRRYFSENL